jgi:hypothetical protein
LKKKDWGISREWQREKEREKWEGGRKVPEIKKEGKEKERERVRERDRALDNRGREREKHV